MNIISKSYDITNQLLFFSYFSLTIMKASDSTLMPLACGVPVPVPVARKIGWCCAGLQLWMAVRLISLSFILKN